MHLDIWTDGGARGNPGPAGIGVVIRDGGKVVGEYKRFISTATNNQAEYQAVILALTEARSLHAKTLRVHLDSELVASQLRREFKVKDKELASLFVKAWNLLQGFSKVEFVWIPREKNTDADSLVNQAIDEST